MIVVPGGCPHPKIMPPTRIVSNATNLGGSVRASIHWLLATDGKIYTEENNSGTLVDTGQMMTPGGGGQIASYEVWARFRSVVYSGPGGQSVSWAALGGAWTTLGAVDREWYASTSNTGTHKVEVIVEFGYGNGSAGTTPTLPFASSVHEFNFTC